LTGAEGYRQRTGHESRQDRLDDGVVDIWYERFHDRTPVAEDDCSQLSRSTIHATDLFAPERERRIE
jgi:hypothetical protein